MLRLYDAARCPYCARVRIVLAEKGVSVETVAIDLADRPAWIYEKNPLGKVPVLEGDRLCLPESAVIMEYLEERFPEPPLLPHDLEERAAVRLRIFRFDRFGDAYYAVRRGEETARADLADRLEELEAAVRRDGYLGGRAYGLADIVPVKQLTRPVTLKEIKADPFFKDFDLVRISRLSVMPVTDAQWTRIEKLAAQA